MSPSSMPLSADSSSWSLYFKTQPEYEDLFDDKTYVERLKELSRVLFGDSTTVEIIESSASADRVTKTQCQGDDSLTEALSETLSPQLRIISITQSYSISPLNITEKSMCKIFTHHHIPPGFLDILCGFGDKKVSSDEGFPSGVYRSFDGRSHDIFYQFSYVEQNNRKNGSPWSMRQTGVYHRFSETSKLGDLSAENLWLLLHPMRNSKAQTRLGVAAEKIDARDMTLDPLRLHVLIMSSYIDNWRWYLHDIKRRSIELEDVVFTTELRDNGLNFDTLQILRHLASKLIPVPKMLESLIATVASIQDMNNRLLESTGVSRRVAETAYHLGSCSSRLQGYLVAAEMLQKRIDNMTKFLADGLNTQSNDHLLTLTKDTVEDSATVRAITLVTLIYLPASFISGVFGMNLFKFNDNTTAFDISNQFWIYLAATIPLTILTLGYWRYKTLQQRKQKQQREAAGKTDIV